MNKTPKGERLSISVIGKTNTGKSSLINALIGQNVSIVSEHPGTTTDPVVRSYELIPIGPVTFYDTAGLDDQTELGQKRIASAMKVLNRSDIVLLVVDEIGITKEDRRVIEKLLKAQIPYLIVRNKSELLNKVTIEEEHIEVSALNQENIDGLKERIVNLQKEINPENRQILEGIVSPGQVVVLVIPIDTSAPKGRVILPQVQVLRECLDIGAISISVRDFELEQTIELFGDKISLVVTDSQAVEFVNKTVPSNIRLTTFSTLFARYKGELFPFVEGAEVIDQLENGDEVLVAEACSHHVMGDDIGKVKLPNWIRKYTGKDIKFTVVNGFDFPEDLEKYKLVIHCGGCMITAKEIHRRIRESKERQVPISNYGILISKIHGVLDRIVSVFPESKKEKN